MNSLFGCKWEEQHSGLWSLVLQACKMLLKKTQTVGENTGSCFYYELRKNVTQPSVGSDVSSDRVQVSAGPNSDSVGG